MPSNKYVCLDDAPYLHSPLIISTFVSWRNLINVTMMSNKGIRFWWFIEKEEPKEMCCCYFGLSQFETGMFRICLKKIAKLEARKAEPARLQLVQEAKAQFCLNVDRIGCSLSWKNLRVIFFWLENYNSFHGNSKV